MSNIGVLCEEIGRVIRSPETVPQDRLDSLVTEFNTLVAETNERLLTIMSWWRMGLRSEAAAAAGSYPDLMAQCTLLDLRGNWPDWADVVVQADLGQAEAVDHELRAGLAVALEEYRQLEPLIDMLRRTARRGGALGDRMRVLRRLMAADLGNDSWRQQCIALEQRFFKEAQTAAQQALATRNAQGLQKLLQELSANSWISAPPPGLLRGLQVAAKDLAASMAAEEYRVLSTSIHESYASQDSSTALSLWADWLRVGERYGVEPSRTLANDLEPALDWMRDLAAREDAERTRTHLHARLEQELDTNAPLEQLRRTIRDIDKTGAAADPVLRRRVEHVTAAESLRARRQRAAVLSVFTVAMLAAATFTSIDLIRRHRSTLLHDITQQVDTLLNSDPARLEEASAVLEAFAATHPKLAVDPAIQNRSFQVADSLKRLSSLQGPVRAKLALVEQLGFSDEHAWDELTELETMLGELTHLGGVNEGDALPMQVEAERDRLEADLASFVAELRRAHRLARATLEGKAANVEREASNELDPLKAAQIRRESLQPHIEQLESLAESVQEPSASSTIVRTAIRERLNDEHVVTVALRDVLQGRVDDAGAYLVREHQRDRMLNTIASFKGSPVRLQALLQQYVETFPEIGGRGGRLAQHFAEVLANASAWDGLARYEEVRQLIRHESRLGSEAEATRRLSLVDELVDRWATVPDALTFYRDYLTHARTALLAESAMQTGLSSIADGAQAPGYLKLNEVRVPQPDGRDKVYLTASGADELEPISNPGEVVVGYRLSGVVRHPNQLLVLPESDSKTIITVQPGTVLQVSPAAHVEMFRQLRLTALDPSGLDWDSRFLSLGRVATQYEINPMLTIEICREFIRLHLDSSWCTDEDLAAFRAACDAVHDRYVTTDWVWPDDDAGRSARQAAERVLREHDGAFERARRNMELEWRQRMSHLPQYAPAGVIWLDDVGQPTMPVTLPEQDLFWFSMIDDKVHRNQLKPHSGEQSVDLPPPGTPIFVETDR